MDDAGATRLKGLLDRLHVSVEVVARDIRPYDLRLPPGRQEHSKFYCIHAGRGVHEVDGRSHPVAAGDVVFVPRGAVHVDNPSGRRTYGKVYCHFNADAAGMDLAAFLELPAVIHAGRAAAAVRTRFEELLAHHQGRDPVDGLRADAALRGILAWYIAATPAAERRFRWSQPLSRLDRAIAILAEDLRREHRLDELARSVEVHPNHLCRLFTRAVGLPPHRYLKRLRLRRAEELLRTTDLAIEAIAGQVGFASVPHFTRAFAALFGAPPAHHRRSARTR